MQNLRHGIFDVGFGLREVCWVFWETLEQAMGMVRWAHLVERSVVVGSGP